MENILLSIDWDYFMPYMKNWNGSCIENKRSIIKQWYKKYFESKMNGIDIVKNTNAGCQLNGFWDKLDKHFKINSSVKLIISDSHKFSYDIAKENLCSEVYSFDSHSDLGYGGISSLKFEVNCANWLGKLLSNGIISRAHIIYSPYTPEKPENFSKINDMFNIRYDRLNDLGNNMCVKVIHICRSGAWTPPWLDSKFASFIKRVNIPFKIVECPKRGWNPEKLNLASQIDLMF